MIAIVDYGMGNLRSVHKGLERVGFPARVTQDPAVISRAGGLILPGVGAFCQAMENLRRLHLIEPIREFIAGGKPFLGICLGLQLLFTESEEFGIHRGLDVFPGRVVRFPFAASDGPLRGSRKVPHMGWNTVRLRNRPAVLQGVEDGAHFYFVHSYYPVPEDPGIVATTTEYGEEFVSSIGRGNLFACQFHPEKSAWNGLKIYANFKRRVDRERI